MAGTNDQRCAVLTVAIADYGGRLPLVPPVGHAGAGLAALFAGALPDHVVHNALLVPKATEPEVRSAIGLGSHQG